MILRKPDKMFINTVTFFFYPTGHTRILQTGKMLTIDKEGRREISTNNKLLPKVLSMFLGKQKTKNKVTGKKREILKVYNMKKGKRKIDAKWKGKL